MTSSRGDDDVKLKFYKNKMIVQTIIPEYINIIYIDIYILIYIYIYIYQAQNRKGCLTAPLSVTVGHILIQIGKSFGILNYWVYMKKVNDDWWITSVPAIRLQKWRISLNCAFLLICV